MKHMLWALAFCTTMWLNNAQAYQWDIDEDMVWEFSPYWNLSPILDTQNHIQQRFLDIVSNHCADTHWLQYQPQWFHYYPEPRFNYHVLPKRITVCDTENQERLWVVPMEIIECWVRSDTWWIICTLKNNNWRNPVCIPEPGRSDDTFWYGDCREVFPGN